MTQWIYFFGERNGRDIKIGRTTTPDLRNRLAAVNRDQTTTEQYVILAGVRGIPINERDARAPFTIRTDKGSRTEYCEPTQDLEEYVNWLRAQWFTTPDGTEPGEEMPTVDASMWLPAPDRRMSRPEPDPTKLVQDYETRPTNLAGTAWSWMVDPRASIQDYFTPTHIMDAAREAMGDIDLDAASHYLANKVHKIPDYFHINRSAFENPWYGRVWLNPPYGDNAPWLHEIERHVASHAIDQLCMLSPVWAFTTKTARPVMELSSAFVLLTPTPKFWGNSDPSRTGTNNPHGIMYIGDNPKRFLHAHRQYGMPLTFRWDLVDEFTTPAPT